MSSFSKSVLCISSTFDSGNIEVVSCEGTSVDLHIRNEPFTESEQAQHKQWFHFRSSGGKGVECSYVISNAGDCSFPEAWPGYNVCTSYDRCYWFRVPTTFEDGKLKWSLNAEYDVVYFAFWAPYSHERHLDLIGRCVVSNRAQTKSLGKTLDGRDLDLVTFGTGKLKVWAVARQHPGESMAEWWMEGFINRLLDTADAQVRKLLEEATVYLVPNMNPDGSVRGHLRTNACGANLNREWTTTGSYEAPTLERSPEVYYVLQELDAVGCDMFIDVHGDEGLPHNFLAGMEGIPKWGPRLESLQATFTDRLVESNPDFQTEFGYNTPKICRANLSVCSNQIAERFDCLAVTFEMPYKDTAFSPEPVQEWSPERAIRMAQSFIDAITRVLPDLRDPEVEPQERVSF